MLRSTAIRRIRFQTTNVKGRPLQSNNYCGEKGNSQNSICIKDLSVIICRKKRGQPLMKTSTTVLTPRNGVADGL